MARHTTNLKAPDNKASATTTQYQPDIPAEGSSVLVRPSQKVQPRWVTRGLNSLAGAAMFIAPLLVLVIIWAIVVPLFQINPRVFRLSALWVPPLQTRSVTAR